MTPNIGVCGESFLALGRVGFTIGLQPDYHIPSLRRLPEFAFSIKGCFWTIFS